ncbi:MAG: DNA polymerase IV [Erysipelotrichaceae bacterium]|nr:DNA polymerase IV [Erysipelotrichaceae bacterium]
MKRVILHCDLNCFYASVEMLYHPELRNVPMAVAGDPENRHGIILAKNVPAKKRGVKTAEAIHEARKKCPELLIRQPDYDSYMYYSDKVRDLYYEYTDRIEAFGADECWLDISSSIRYFGSIKRIVEDILRRVKEEIGLTLSIGVSNNKIWAKLGSDIASEDSYFVISRLEDIGDLPASDLLNVGHHTYEKLKSFGLYTIADIAGSSPSYLKGILGKNGEILWHFANGHDLSRVKRYEEKEEAVKSIGNSVTTHRDICGLDDLKLVLTVLCDSVSSRLKDAGMFFKTVHLSLRNRDLEWRGMQMSLKENSDLAKDIYDSVLSLFERNGLDFKTPYRSIGVAVSNLSCRKEASAIDIYGDSLYSLKEKKRDLALEDIRKRFGYHSIGSLRLYEDNDLAAFDPKSENLVHPVSYFGR